MTDWRKFFTPSEKNSLDFFPPDESNGTPIVSPPLEVFEEGDAEWKNSVIAQFLGDPPSFTVLQKTLAKVWEKQGNVRIKLAGRNLYIFQFEKEQTLSWILENGPWHVHHIPIILRKWEPDIGKLDLALDKLPLWFHLHDVPLDLYTRSGLSYIASAIGTPLYMDSITATKKRLAYAKVCVEADAAIEPPEQIEIMMRDGSITSIVVSIPWRPPVCKKCALFGHTDASCRRKTEMVWKPKATVKETEKKAAEITTDTGEVTSVTEKTAARAAITPRPSSVPTAVNEQTSQINAESSKSKDKGKSTAKIASSTNKYVALCEEICPVGIDFDAVVEEDTEDNVTHDTSKEIWEHLINNATYTPKRTRATAKEASRAWAGLKSKKAELIAKGNRKDSAGPGSPGTTRR